MRSNNSCQRPLPKSKMIDRAQLEAIVDDNASAEYYNLQSVRVENPAAGLYIRRQGSKVEKVIVR